MKILIVIDYFQPKLGYSENFFSKEFVKLGHEVKILTSNFYFPFPDYNKTMKNMLGQREVEEGEVTQDGITIVRKKLILEVFTRAIFGGHEEILQNFHPDLVLVNKSAGYSTIRMAMLKRKYNYKLYCYDSHLPSELLRGNIIIKQIFYFLFRLFFANLLNSKVDKFIAVQAKTKDVMKDYFGIKKNIVTIPLGTDIKKFRFSKKEREVIRKKYKIKTSDFVILYTGKVVEAKGVDLLFQAFNLLCQEHQNIKLMIVGEGTEEYIRHCFSLVEKKFQEKIKLVPFQPIDQLYKYYSAVEVAVWPLQESTSMNDAASCSLPFIANDELGDKTRIGNNNALLYKKGDVAILMQKIEYLYKNPKIKNEMAKNGRELAERELSWNRISKQYLN